MDYGWPKKTRSATLIKNQYECPSADFKKSEERTMANLDRQLCKNEAYFKLYDNELMIPVYFYNIRFLCFHLTCIFFSRWKFELWASEPPEVLPEHQVHGQCQGGGHGPANGQKLVHGQGPVHSESPVRRQGQVGREGAVRDEGPAHVCRWPPGVQGGVGDHSAPALQG